MEGRHAKVDALQEGRLADPITFFTTEHAHQRVLLGHLDRLARHANRLVQVPVARVTAARLQCGLPPYFLEQSASLYPRFCAVTATLTSTLTVQAKKLKNIGKLLRRDLACIVSDHRATQKLVLRALSFVQAYRQRSKSEQLVLMPLARRLLTQADRETIAHEMAARRR